MFYSNEILSRKGKLGLVWIAANFDGSGTVALTKREYFTINIMQICCVVMEPPRPFALRLSSKLLLGISRVYAKQTHYLLVELRHVWERIKTQSNSKSINLSPTKARNRAEAVTLSDPFADPLAQFNAWLSSNTTDVLNSSISDFDFPSESEFYVLTDSHTVDLKEITIEEEEFPNSSISVLDDDGDFGDVGLQFDQQDDMDANSVGAMDDYPEAAVVQNSDPQNDSVLLYDEVSGGLRALEEAPVIKSPGNFVLEELTPDHVQPVRHKKSNVRHKKKAIFISDSKFSECLRNPSDLLQPKAVVCRTKAKELFDNAGFALNNKGAHHLVDVWKRNAKIEPYAAFHSKQVPREVDDGSEASIEILRAQHSIDTAYEESREGISQLSHLTPSNDQSSLFSIPSSYEFEMTSTQSKLMSQPVSMGNLSPIMDLPELDDIDMDVGDISLPSLNDSDLESEASVTSAISQQLHHALQEIVYQMVGRDDNDIEFSSLLPQPCSRKTAAKRFSQLLALTSKQIVCVSQDVAYGAIVVKKGPQFNICNDFYV